MKRFTTILSFLFLVLFIGTTLFIFQIPPFDQSTLESLGFGQTTEPPIKKEELEFNNLSFEDHIKKGDNFRQNGFDNLAIKEYQAANKVNPKSVIPLIKIGELHLQKGNFSKAQLSFEAALNTEPENVTARIQLARTLISQKEIEQARETLNQVNSTNPEVKYYQALLAILNNNHDQARNLFQEAVESNQDPVITGKAEKFLNAYKEFDSFQSGADSHLKTLLARSFTKTEEYQMAIPLLFDVIRQKSDYRDAWILLGYSYLKTDKPLEAIDSLEEAKKLDPQKPETLFFLGLSYFNNDDLVAAADNIETAIQNGFEPRIQAEQKLAEIYTIIQDFDKAAQRYENVITLNSSNVNYFVRPVWIYLDYLEDSDKAYTLARKAVALHPNEAMSHNLLGWVNLKKGKVDLARHNLTTALQINPQFDAAHLNLGLLYEKEQNYSLAREHYKIAHEIGKGNSISEIASDHFQQIADKVTPIEVQQNEPSATQNHPNNNLFKVNTLNQ